MSWLNWANNTSKNENHPEFSVNAAEARRLKLESERKSRREARDKRQLELQSIRQQQELYNQGLSDLFSIAVDIFESDLSDNQTPVSMPNFDELNADNGADAIKNLGQIKISWDAEEPAYFFQKLETELQIFEVNKQFTKRQALLRCLPDDVAKEFKHLVTLQENAAGTQAYKTLKTAILKAYGPRPEHAFQRAMARVMVGKPSSLLKLLIADICPTQMAGCTHCATTIWGLFQLQIPMYLKNALANDVFSEATMHDIMDRADNSWAANQPDTQISSVEKPAAPEKTSEIAAVSNRGRGGRGRGQRGNRGGRGGGRGGNNNSNQNDKPDPRGQRHSSNPPWNSCKAHWQFAGDAWACQSPTTCPLKDQVTPKNSNRN